MVKMHSGAAGAFLLSTIAALAACAEAAPPPPKPVEAPPKPTATVTETATATAEPEPVGDGSKDAPFHLKIGGSQALPIEVKVRPYSGFVVEEPSDVVVAWTGGDVALVGPDGVSVPCSKSPCLVPVAMKGFYRVTRRGGEEGAPPKVAVSVSALALPKAVAMKPGKAATLKLKAIAQGDPRGPSADAALHYDAPAHQTIDVRPLGKKRSATLEDLVRRVSVEVIGAGERPVTVMSASPDVGGALRISFDAAAGDYVVRATSKDEHTDALEVTVRKTETPVNPSKAAAPPVPAKAASLPKIKAGGKADFEVASDPVQSSVWLDIPAGGDLAIAWRSSGEPLSLFLNRKGVGSFLVHDSPWFLVRAAPGVAELAPFASDDPITVQAEARVLPLPAIAATIEPGKSATVTTAPVAADDLRGAIAEIGIELSEAGDYQLAAQIVGFQPAASVGASSRSLAKLQVFGPNGESVIENGTLLSGADIQAGISRETFHAAAAGKYVVRIDGEGEAPARKIELRCDKPSTKSSD